METNRGRTHLHLGHTLALVTLAVLFWAGTPVSGQSMPSQDNDTRNWQLATMDRFLDSHPEIAEQLQKDPSLINNQQFIANHPGLQEFLQTHPGVREEFSENPNAFMRQEQRFERREEAGGMRFGNDTTRAELANLDRFLDSHPEIAEQLQKDPSLINNQQFIEKHPGLQEFLQTHPGVREEFKENPKAFMRQEQRFERQEEAGNMRFGDGDTTLRELANMDRFLDSHPEIAEQLQKDPSLINNQQFIANHPGLQEFLQTHPGVREELTENPNAFMRREQRFERREEAGNLRFGDGDTTRRELANMDRFLDSHPEVAEQLQKDPSLINNQQFIEKHPGLQEFLQTHPGVREEFRENPNAFMRQEQRFERREEGGGMRFGNDTTRAELANMDRFLDSHQEIAEQLQKDPSLIKDQQFVTKHPELQEFLQSHPGVREEFRENPNAFMRQERRFERHEDFDAQGIRERNTSQGEMMSFGRFLSGHSSLGQQLSKDPSLVNNKEWLESHPELGDFLKSHPGAKAELMKNPQAFMNSVQQASNSTATAKPVLQPKHKQ